MEIPVCPENLQRKLQEFDSRFRLIFNTIHGVWQVQERLRSKPIYSHVMYWADGDWQTGYKYRPLPLSADPILDEIAKRDILRHASDMPHFVKQLEINGENAHAARMAKAEKWLEQERREYMKWAMRNAERLRRKYQYGGRSQAEAERELLDFRKERECARQTR